MINNIADEPFRQMAACLMNAVAFDAKWAKVYEEDDISKGAFNNADGTVTKVQMLSSAEDTYIEDEFFTGFMRPYKDNKYALMALLPKRSNSAAYLIRAIKQLDFTKLLDESVHETVYATMPEFKCDFGDNITWLCRELGINTLFTPEADFSPMSSEWLKLDSIRHKAHIEVNRNGTKAVVITWGPVEVGCTPIIEHKTVCLDRPFVYAIMNTETGLPVFAGVYNQANA